MIKLSSNFLSSLFSFSILLSVSSSMSIPSSSYELSSIIFTPFHLFYFLFFTLPFPFFSSLLSSSYLISFLITHFPSLTFSPLFTFSSLFFSPSLLFSSHPFYFPSPILSPHLTSPLPLFLYFFIE